MPCFPTAPAASWPARACRPAARVAGIYLDGGPDLAATLQRVERAGGKVLLPITTLADGNGDIALMEDSEGNCIGLHVEP
ncbi:hypothetical protein [Aquitalea magnusonii]|uniref:hypothetical protein n=1 Tax=Aquitalea magnusonii TaxID=332411 RepID=UPI00075067F6|nr:hypothetical protein [Aquitalea magnusonii]